MEGFALDTQVALGQGVLVVSGEIDAACVEDFLGGGLALLAHPDVTELVVDLAQVGFIDSSGLSVLVRLHHAGRALDKPVTLREPSRVVAGVLRLTALDTLLPVLADPIGPVPRRG